MKPSDNQRLACLHLSVSRNKIGLLKFLLEGYDGLCTLTTIDAKLGQVKLITPKSRFSELKEVLDTIPVQLDLNPNTLN